MPLGSGAPEGLSPLSWVCLFILFGPIPPFITAEMLIWYLSKFDVDRPVLGNVP